MFETKPSPWGPVRGLGQGRRLYVRQLRTSRRSHHSIPACRARHGELGWQQLAPAEDKELELGTLVGAGSYGIVREAKHKGSKVRTHPLPRPVGVTTTCATAVIPRCQQ